MQSEQIDKLAEALAKAQAAITSPPRNREVTVKSDKGSYKFKYATLDGIIEHVREPLTKNGLWFTQTLANGDGKYRLVTRVVHSSGQWVGSETPLFVMPNNKGEMTNQAFGSALTYMKRYALAAILGIAADEDDDANEADGNTVESSKDRAPAMKAKLATVTKDKDWTAEAKAIFKKMREAEDQDERDMILSDRSDDLKEIQKHNPKAHTEIMKISTGKQEAA